MMAPTFKHVIRKDEDLTFPHRHLPSAETLMSRRVVDAETDSKIHMLAWRYHIKRKQWEAVCEKDDVIMYAKSSDTAADIAFRKGRSYE